MEISVPNNCENAPKQELIRDVNIAFAKGDIAFLDASTTDDIEWDIIGESTIEGKEEFIQALEYMKNSIPKSLTLQHILTHGKEGAAHGIMQLENGKTYAFSDFYIFNSAKASKIKQITSLVIEI